jgi:hypothetical protein
MLCVGFMVCGSIVYEDQGIVSGLVDAGRLHRVGRSRHHMEGHLSARLDKGVVEGGKPMICLC